MNPTPENSPGQEYIDFMTSKYLGAYTPAIESALGLTGKMWARPTAEIKQFKEAYERLIGEATIYSLTPDEYPVDSKVLGSFYAGYAYGPLTDACTKAITNLLDQHVLDPRIAFYDRGNTIMFDHYAAHATHLRAQLGIST